MVKEERNRQRGYGDLAQAIMEVVGHADRPLTPAQVREALGEQLAYTTVMTVLARLHDQGVLRRERAGRAFAYTAIGDPANVTARRMHRLLDVDRDRAGVLAHFVDALTPEDERVLRDLLQQVATDQIATDQAATDQYGPAPIRHDGTPTEERP
ncbi:BlaI/MecI/CopY family transcriptional regulator [Rugosimonospora acidiphila]|uniref:BlaI/MecI/CopY family transcriptional regulator n=1 Tax=Rugosimonospora acidiphila TaxID=556531 RepID=A0ABP9RSY7_9ACTN